MQFKELKKDFFNRDASLVAVDLLGKIIQHKVSGIFLKSIIIETESYYIKDKGSHASLGWTQKRDALFSDPGTIYMYYARGNDSLNFSAKGDGNAVLIKSAFPVITDKESLKCMLKLNPKKDGTPRPPEKLCSGQTLLCKAMDLKVKDFDGKRIPLKNFKVTESDRDQSDIDQCEYIQTLRLGIPKGRDENLWQRFLLKDFAEFSTKNPLTQRVKNYRIFSDKTDIDYNKTAGPF